MGFDISLMAFARRRQCEVHSALDFHRREARRQQLDALGHHLFREDGGGGGAVAGDIAGFLRDLANDHSAHVLETVFELDFLDHRDAVLGHQRCAEGALDQDVAAFGAEGDLRGFGDQVGAANDADAGFLVKLNHFG